MIRRFFPALAAILVAASAFSLASAAEVFRSTPLMQEETRMVVSLLDEVHYLNHPVSDETFEQLITEFMSDLDQQRLFFTAADEKAFRATYGPSMAHLLRQEGSLDVAFRIFAVYKERAQARIGWIKEELQKDIDFTADEYYEFDRSEKPWPATLAEADDLWRKRIKFELIPDLLNDKTLDEARETVVKRYERLLENLEEIEAPEVQELFLSTLTRMYDPHSTFFSAETLEDFSISMRLSLVGIGALLASEDGYCVIKELIPGGPASLSGQLHPNDKIIAVQQEGEEPVDIIGMNLRKVVKMIRGKKGTPITLTIVPADAADTSTQKQLTLIRDIVQLNASRATAEVHEVPGPNGTTMPIGVIDIPSFYGPVDEVTQPRELTASVSRDVEELIEKLKARGVKGIILDLRRNGGGLLSEAVDLTGLFIPKGPVVIVRDSYGRYENRPDPDPRVAYDGPLMVLTSRYSASASEIVAGALQNYGRAIIVGDRSTHGKGTVQAVLEMRDFLPRSIFTTGATGATKLTVQKFYLPNGSSTQNRGVIPDISLPAVEDFLPIGEADLPHSLPWDTIQGLNHPALRSLTATFRERLLTASQGRIAALDEFDFLQKRIDWFREREEMKAISLNLEERRRMKEQDEAFREEMKAWQRRLAELNYPSEKVALDSVANDENAAPTMEELLDNSDETDGDEEPVPPFDVHLREALRILRDAILLQPDSHEWTKPNPTIAAVIPQIEAPAPEPASAAN